DMMTTGKGMSAGYTPIAAVIIREHIMEAISNGSKQIMGGHTFSSNPLSAATANAVLNYVQTHQLVERSAENGAYLFDKLEAMAATSDLIGDVRGKGLFAGVEFVADKTTRIPFPATMNLTEKVVQAAYEEGLLIYPANAGTDGVEGDAIIIAPPLTITKSELDILVKKFQQAIKMVENS